MSRTLYEVAGGGQTVASFETREEADEFRRSNGGQIRVRAEKRAVPAAFAVFVNGEQVGETHTDPGSAAKAAKAIGSAFVAAGCDVEAIVLAGTGAGSEPIRTALRRRVGRLAPVMILESFGRRI